VNEIRISQALAAGSNSGSRTATLYCDSLDNWADTIGAPASDPASKIGGARTGFTPMGRILVVVH
jgi:hypothetical protein